MNKKQAIGLCNCKCADCEQHRHKGCEFNCDNRKYIISQGCCPNCYAPEPCECNSLSD